jgi:CheY-like chemotaxis protein/DNA-directed RNA polymerase subunit RPC12/RpoP
VKVEVRCTGCGKAYLLDPSKVPAGGTVEPCPACGSSIALPAPAAAPEPSPASGTHPVVCPRCGLHFSVEGAPTAPAAARRPRVLLVEDMEFFREIARQALEATVDLVQARTLAEARRALAQGGFDLLLLDLALENEDGRDLLRQLPRKPCPILIFTARDESDMYGAAWDELRAFGADDVVVKGMQMGEALARKVAALLARAA